MPQRFKVLSAKFSLLTLLIVCFSCSSNNVDKKSTSYELPDLWGSWTKIDADNSDHAFRNSSNSIIIINTTCMKYDSTKVDHLQHSLLSGLDVVKVEEKKQVSLFDRKGIESKISTSLDGIKTHLILTTVRKDRCIYDFALIASDEKRLLIDAKDYNKFLRGINIK